MEQVVGIFAAFLVTAGPLAVGVTKAVDLIRNVADKNDTMPKFTWNVAAFVLGIGLCIGWGYNLAAALAEAIPKLTGSGALTGTSGELLTGIAVGAMASFWHEPLSGWGAKAGPVAP